MVEEVGDFIDAAVIVAANRRERDLDAFLADLLANPRRALLEELAGIAGGIARAGALGNDCRKRREPTGAWRWSFETARRSKVADWTGGLGEDEQGIAVAVGEDAAKVYAVAAGLALLPKLFP